MTDIRLKTSLFTHRKTKRLRKMLGDGALIALLTLWASAAENRPDGDLTGLSAEDIALDADWDGNAEQFVTALGVCGWLDGTDGHYRLHDWADHQGYVIHAPERQAKARKAAEARWRGENAPGNAPRCYEHAQSNATSMLQACSEHTASMRKACGGHAGSNAPDPDPSPEPNPSPPPPIAPPLPPAVGGGDDGGGGAPPPNCPATVQTVQPVDSSPGEHMPLPECADLYRQCFAGKNHLQVAPMVLAKLSVLASSHSRAEMLHAFEQAAMAGATSINYLEKTLAGKRTDAAQGHPQGRPLSRQAEAAFRLAEWAKGEWLKEEIAAGMAKLIADGKRDGMPSADLIVVTAGNYLEALLPYQLTPEERGRVQAAFEQAKKLAAWPRAKDICDLLPRRRPQEALPEETVRGSPMPLWTGFMEMKKEMREANQQPKEDEPHEEHEDARNAR